MTSRPTVIYRTPIAVVSLVLGPLLMSVGDLIHPVERTDSAEQARIIIEHASRWYAAHLLLFAGMLIFVPGIFAVTDLAAERRPAAGHAARIFLVTGMSAFAAVFMAEMLMGRYAWDGADLSAVTRLLDTFGSFAILGFVMAGAVLFYSGIGVFGVPLVADGGALRGPALLLILGSLLILIEIISAEVIFSQIGNVVNLAAGAAFARQIARREREGT